MPRCCQSYPTMRRHDTNSWRRTSRGADSSRGVPGRAPEAAAALILAERGCAPPRGPRRAVRGGARIMPTYQAGLDRVITDVIAPNATQVDRNGEFPRAGIQALGQAGVLGLLSAAEV